MQGLALYHREARSHPGLGSGVLASTEAAQAPAGPSRAGQEAPRLLGARGTPPSVPLSWSLGMGCQLRAQAWSRLAADSLVDQGCCPHGNPCLTVSG